MKIKEIKIANYLGIENIGIENISEKGVAFSGKSRIGKTSILDAIVQAVTNNVDREKILRDDSQPAKIYVKMDNGLEILRVFSPDGGKDTILSVDGGHPNAPERYLKGLLGDKVVMIDPSIMLLKGKEKELSEQILSLLSIKVTKKMAQEWFGETPPVDYNNHGLLVCKDIETLYYTRRADINRGAKLVFGGIETAKEKLPENYNPEDWKDVSLSGLFKKVEDGIAVNREREHARFLRDSEQTDIEEMVEKHKMELFVIDKSVKGKCDAIDSTIGELQKKIRELQMQKETILESTNDLKSREYNRHKKMIEARKLQTRQAEDYIDSHPAVDVDSLREEAERAEEMKGYLWAFERVDDMVTDSQMMVKQSAELTEKINKARSKPIELLRENRLPIKNLGIDEKGKILINNLPIKNLSTSEIVELLCDIEIAKTSDLQFVCVDRWESLGEEDSDVPKIIKKKFEEAGIQLFYAEVTSGELKIIEI